MATSRGRLETIDEYIAQFPKNVRDILQELRRAIKESAPDAEETISYGMPAFKLRGKALVYFAAWKKHIGFYPIPSAIEAFKKELSPFKQAKGAVQFPYDAVPFDLVKRIVRFRVEENESQKLLLTMTGRTVSAAPENVD